MGLDVRMRTVKVVLVSFWSLSLMAAALAQDSIRAPGPFLPPSMNPQSRAEISVPGPDGREIAVPLELGFPSNRDRKKLRSIAPQINPYSSAVFRRDSSMTIVFSAEPAQSWKASNF